MKKAEVNQTVIAACEKFNISPPARTEIQFDKKSNTVTFPVSGSVPAVLLNSLGRAFKVKPANIFVLPADSSVMLTLAA